MSHFALLWKARSIEKYRLKYENEKIRSIILSNAEIPDRTLFQRWRHYRHDLSRHISRTFSRWYPEGTTVSNFLVHIKDDMKFPQILLRSLFGFTGGLILTYLCFIFFVFQLSLSLVNATVLSSIIGVLLTLGLTFSNRMRCLMFLLIPQLFSRVGRYTLTCYALVLILTGPATNTLRNLEVLSESMACSQEHIKTHYKQLNDYIRTPFNSIKLSLDLMIERLRKITSKLKVALIDANRVIITISSIIQSTFVWLDKVTKSCNNHLGSPYHRCMMALMKSAKHKCTTCKYSETCTCPSFVNFAKKTCEQLGPYKSFCFPNNYSGETFVATIRTKLRHFIDRISQLMSLHIKVYHSYSFAGNSGPDSPVTAGIVTEMRNRADPLLTWLSWSSCVTSLFLLLIIFRAKHYQRMYESRSRFDNRYITNEFRALDLKRLREGRETVLPLNRRERAKYVTTTSFRLVASEKVYINRSVIFMIITTFKLMIHIVADYSLYWVLMMIRYHGTKETLLKPGIPDTGIRVSGHGFVAKFLRSSLKTMNIPLMFPSFSNKSCLPNPQPPDYKRYTQIGILIVLLWFFALFEPYGLRLRHIIVGHYRPERAKTRALWLYNYILRTRGSFMKLARRKLHREFKYSSESKYTLRSWIRSVIPFLWLQRMLSVIEEQSKCLLCNATKDSNDPHTTIIRCDVPNCPGTYCTKCFSDIGEMCTICLPPLDYVDLSDVSMEKGSSDEDSNDDEVPNTSANNAAKEQQNVSSEDSVKGSQPKQINRVIEQEDHTESSDSSKSSGHREIREIYPLLDRNYRINNRVLHNTVYRENCRSKIRDHKVSEDKNLCLAYKTNITTRFKSSRCSITRFKFSNYDNLSFFSVYIALSGPNTMPIKHTSLNPINIVPEKSIENLKKSTEDYVITCNNNKGDDNKKIKKTKKREKSVENKDSKKKNKKSKKERKSTKNNPNGDEAEKPTKKEKKLKSERSRKRSTHTLHNIKQYCKKMFVYMLPNKKEPKIQPSDSKKQKKKKKRKKEKDKIIIHKSETEYKSTIRLFDRGRVTAYLTELDWIMNTKKDKSRKTRPKCPNFFEDETPKDVVKFNDIIIPKLNLDFTLETFCYDDTHATRTGRSSSVEHMQYKSKTNYSRNAIERFFKKALKSNNSDGSKKGSPDYNYDRPMKYFTSIGHQDFLSNIDLTFTDLNDIERLLASQSQAFIDNKEVEKKKDEDNEIEKVPDNNFIENVEQEKDEGEGEEEEEGEEGEDGEEISSSSEEEEREVNNENDEMEEKNDAITENEEKTESKKDYFWMPKESLSNLSFKLSQFSRRPISMVKGLCNAMLVPSDVKICQRLRGHRKHSGEKTTDKNKSDATKFRKVDDKDIMACPNTCSCATQKNLPRRNYTKSIESAQVQNTRGHAYHKEYHCGITDVGVEVCNSTCTCATQCYISSRDVGTFRNGRLRQDEDRYNSSRDTVSSMNESYTDSLISQTTESYLEISDVDDDDDDEKTDTTIYSLPTIDMSRGFNRHCINLGKKNNRSTSMMPRKYVDANTITDDWWSPLLEKQNNFKVRLRSNNAEKSTSMSDDSDSCRSRTKEGSKRVVTFKSSAQIIPKTSAKEKEIGKTPSRLVLEIPRIYKTAEKNTSSSSRCCNYRRNRRAKRLEERYSPRKLHNSKHKRTEVVRNSNKMR